ncbi:hypothetical protein VB779_09430 [Haloarculaceae archaeon H-GB11]|nr:hypothetical protein [Haloarculaceae archaeon H-GB11]
MEDEDNVETYKIRSSSGSKFLRKPAKKYEEMTMVVTDYSLTIHDDAELNMVNLSTDIGKSTEEIYYDTISSMNYENGVFT